MDLIVTGVVAGILGTFVMDLLNHLFAQIGLLIRIDMGMIGRMSAGWAQGRFRYRHPGEMKQVANEMALGYLTHYAIGVGLAKLTLPALVCELVAPEHRCPECETKARAAVVDAIDRADARRHG